MPNKRPTYRAATPKNRNTFAPPEHAAKRTEAYSLACRIRSGPAWIELMRTLKQRRPVCEWCGNRPTEQGHHIEPVAKRPDLALDVDNVMPVCTACHEMIESAIRRGVDIMQIRKDMDNAGNA